MLPRARKTLASVALPVTLMLTATACDYLADPCAEVGELTEADRTVLQNGGEPAERRGARGVVCEYDDGRFQVDE